MLLDFRITEHVLKHVTWECCENNNKNTISKELEWTTVFKIEKIVITYSYLSIMYYKSMRQSNKIKLVVYEHDYWLQFDTAN